MAEPIKSVLLLDYESLQRSLAGAIGETRLAERATVWLGALEAGELGPKGVRRRLMVKRCYAGPSVRGKVRDGLTVAGFEIVEAADGGRSAIDLHLAMDTVDALGKVEGFQEFILLSGAAELAPLLTRLKANKRVTVIFADATTPATDRSLADVTLSGADFARVINTEGAATPAEPMAASSSGTMERSEIEAFARRVHTATSIPLFSPKTFAELFRQLTDEITANGYHFQSTAKNVADRMLASGRSVTRRQVVFIVKGLALKGHVFSTNDTPERLAEVFREQARYLINNAGIVLDDKQESLLSAWFLSRPPAVAPGPLPAGRAPAAPPPLTQIVPEPPDAARAKIAETIEREVAKAIIRPPAPEKAKSPASVRSTGPSKPMQVKPVDLPKSAATKPMPLPAAREEAKAVIAARIAGAARMKPAGARAPLPAKPAPQAPPPPEPEPIEEPPQAEAKPAQPERTARESDALEHSILAAIAEAVDVLVEDSDEQQDALPPPPPPREAQREQPGQRKRGSNHAAPRQPEPEPPPSAPEQPEEDADSNDIGDQIQRIIASYNRNRNDE